MKKSRFYINNFDGVKFNVSPERFPLLSKEINNIFSVLAPQIKIITSNSTKEEIISNAVDKVLGKNAIKLQISDNLYNSIFKEIQSVSNETKKYDDKSIFFCLTEKDSGYQVFLVTKNYGK